MTKNVIPDIAFIIGAYDAGSILKYGEEYDAISNPNGAISGICANGAVLGVRPGEFEFLTAPDWVLRIWDWNHKRHQNPK